MENVAIITVFTTCLNLLQQLYTFHHNPLMDILPALKLQDRDRASPLTFGIRRTRGNVLDPFKSRTQLGPRILNQFCVTALYFQQ